MERVHPNITIFKTPKRTFDERRALILDFYERGLDVMKHLKVKKAITVREHKDTFTINKQAISFCFGSYRQLKGHWHVLFYVFLHELAHVLGEDCTHHDTCFWNRFDTILAYAQRRHGLIIPEGKRIYCNKKYVNW